MSISLASEVELSVISLIAGSGSTLTRQGGCKRKTRWREGWGMWSGVRLFEGGDYFKIFPFKGGLLNNVLLV